MHKSVLIRRTSKKSADMTSTISYIGRPQSRKAGRGVVVRVSGLHEVKPSGEGFTKMMGTRVLRLLVGVNRVPR
jgi:hypothetical protein